MNNEESANNLIAAERRRMICRLAEERGSVNATELSKVLGAGISTIRRDLVELDKQGKLLRVHGGAINKDESQPRTPYKQSRSQHLMEKTAIALAALHYLPESGTIFIGGGTTTYQLALRIPPGREIAVTTNSLDIGAHLASTGTASVDLVGGTVRSDSLQTNCEESLDSLFWDVTFMGLAAIDIHRGITTDNRNTARQEQTVLKHGGKFVALCDSSKIGRFAYAQVAKINIIDVFITDSGADPEFIKQMKSEGVEVVVVEP
ncbi:MAG: DeoR/GlpR family DNA-binding transcription regulator [Armatimonadota bacterium]